MDQYHKIEWAKEEIRRLNLEIRRVITKIHDERVYLLEREERLRGVNPGLAHQVLVYWLQVERFNEVHLRRFQKLSLLMGFTGDLSIGRRLHANDGWELEPASIEEEVRSRMGAEVDALAMPGEEREGQAARAVQMEEDVEIEEVDSDEEDKEDVEKEISMMMEQLMLLSTDKESE